jgi:hypothetical protein
MTALRRIAELEKHNRKLTEELAMTKQAADPDRIMLFPEWCSANGFSASTGARILRSGEGPVVTRLSLRRFGITVAANARWQRARTRRRAHKAWQKDRGCIHKPASRVNYFTRDMQMTNVVSCSDDVVILRNLPVSLGSDVGREFICDVARSSEGLVDDDAVCAKYGLTAKAFRQLTQNKALVSAVAAERERRIRNGTAAQESAARIFVRAPTVLGSILDNELASPKHRIDAANALRQASRPEPDTITNSGEKFVISINFGAGHNLVKEFTPPLAKPADDLVIEGTPNREDHDEQ